MRAQPQTVFDDLITRLNELKKGGDSPNVELEIRRLKREAESLKSSDPAGGFTSLGIIACFEGRTLDMRRYHETALQYSNEYPLHVGNYAISLMDSGFLDEALFYAKLAFERSRELMERIRDALDLVITLTDQLGMKEEFMDYTDQRESLTGKAHELVNLGLDEDDEQGNEQGLDTLPAKYERDVHEDRDCYVRLDPMLFDKAEELVRPVRD